jgi:hypothetical protein
MVNPDKSSGISIGSFTISLPIGILFLAVAITLFQFKDVLPGFNLILWIGIPLFALFVVFGVNLITQYLQCNSVDPGKAVLGAIPSVGTTLFALLISSFTVCRIPVASVFTPLLIGNNVDVTRDKTNTNINSLKNSNYKECCIPKLSLSTIESKFPIIQGISYGFYLMFATFFGITIGNGFATIC